MDDQDKHSPGYCCALRKKIVLNIKGIVTGETCGVSDSVLADVTYFDTNGVATIYILYCPWCGLKMDPSEQRRVTNPEDEV